MRVSKNPLASSSSRVVVSFAVLATWVAIVGSWSCQNVVAFAFTKIPNSLLDDRQSYESLGI